ncbi:MAG: CRISP-associated protein Cas1 [Halanaerobiales bacterium]|nr:CRISP-associated protein Cas1 [Halanaerobiales bacterium]
MLHWIPLIKAADAVTFGRSLGKIWHPKLGSTTYIRRRQLELTETEEGTKIVKELMLAKTKNMIDHLYELGIKRSQEKQEYLNEKLKEIEFLKKKLARVSGPVAEVRNSLMGYEGNISRKYFSCWVVMKLFSRKKVNKSQFDKVRGGLTLNDEGKKLLLTDLNEYFQRKIRYKGREIKIENTIQYDCHNLANRHSQQNTLE